MDIFILRPTSNHRYTFLFRTERVQQPLLLVQALLQRRFLTLPAPPECVQLIGGLDKLPPLAPFSEHALLHLLAQPAQLSLAGHTKTKKSTQGSTGYWCHFYQVSSLLKYWSCGKKNDVRPLNLVMSTSTLTDCLLVPALIRDFITIVFCTLIPTSSMNLNPPNCLI